MVLSFSFSCLLLSVFPPIFFVLFFFNDTATTEIYTLSLHDALPILLPANRLVIEASGWRTDGTPHMGKRSPFCVVQFPILADRKSTRLNSSHTVISYAVFCLKKKKK